VTAPVLTVDQLLALPKEIQSDLVTVLSLIYEQKFTGPVTLHCHLGIPKSIQVPPPQIRLE
jgi:hypothetical protein